MKRLTCKQSKGFTLLELLIVVVVLAVLAGLALPQYLKTVGRAKEAEGWSGLAAIRGAEMRYYAEDPTVTGYTNVLTELDVDDPGAPVNALFDYTIAGGGATFIATATPNAAAGPGVRTLTIDDVGARTSN